MIFFARFIDIIVDIFTIAIIARAIVSWFPLSPGSRIMAFLYQITEPILAPLRRIIPRIGMIDITPIVAIVLLQLIARLVWLIV